MRISAQDIISVKFGYHSLPGARGQQSSWIVPIYEELMPILFRVLDRPRNSPISGMSLPLPRMAS